MRKLLFSMMVLTFIITITGCGKCPCGFGDKDEIFNGKDLDNWTLYLKDSSVDVDTVWSVTDGVVHCTGKPNGYMRTEKQYENYQLHLEWRWPDTPTNSGILLHAQTPDAVWPQCIEAQLKNGNAGDFVIMGEETSLTVKGKKFYDPKSFFGISKKWAASNEKAPGQWNTYDVVCRGDTIQVNINGQLQNVGTKASLTKGYICLQSEGGPIQFRNIKIKELD